MSLARSLDIPRSVHNLRFFAGTSCGGVDSVSGDISHASLYCTYSCVGFLHACAPHGCRCDHASRGDLHFDGRRSGELYTSTTGRGVRSHLSLESAPLPPHLEGSSPYTPLRAASFALPLFHGKLGSGGVGGNTDSSPPVFLSRV